VTAIDQRNPPSNAFGVVGHEPGRGDQIDKGRSREFPGLDQSGGGGSL
jgi:hypothetical protein